VDGLDVLRQPEAAKTRLGVQLQKTALLDDLTLAELVATYAGLYNVFLKPAEIDALLGRYGLAEHRNRLARRLSGGQQQRLALALALANNPAIVLLDEPTTGLDPHARRAVWDDIRRLHDEGRTVLLTTHAMEEAEALCGRVAIIDAGRIAACDTPARLAAGLGAHPVLRAQVEVPLAEAATLPGVVRAWHEGQFLVLETADPQASLAALGQLAAGHGRTLSDVRLRQPNLEDVFLALTGRSLSGSASGG
jgi:ABC-2 type transport system ATP-binding protein